MYILDKDSNQLINAEPTTFKEQKLKERQHLQEWIAKNPEGHWRCIGKYHY